MTEPPGVGLSFEVLGLVTGSGCARARRGLGSRWRHGRVEGRGEAVLLEGGRHRGLGPLRSNRLDRLARRSLCLRGRAGRHLGLLGRWDPTGLRLPAQLLRWLVGRGRCLGRCRSARKGGDETTGLEPSGRRLDLGLGRRVDTRESERGRGLVLRGLVHGRRRDRTRRPVLGKLLEPAGLFVGQRLVVLGRLLLVLLEQLLRQLGDVTDQSLEIQLRDDGQGLEVAQWGDVDDLHQATTSVEVLEQVVDLVRDLSEPLGEHLVVDIEDRAERW